jgi:hypothetical protein
MNNDKLSQAAAEYRTAIAPKAAAAQAARHAYQGHLAAEAAYREATLTAGAAEERFLAAAGEGL